MACAFAPASQLGGCRMAPSTPAAAMSAKASSTRYGPVRWGGTTTPLLHKWICASMMRMAVPSASELSPVTGAQPQSHEMSAPFRFREILIGRATVHDAAIVQDLDLPALQPKIVAMRRIGQEILHQLDAFEPFRVELAAA